MSFTIKPSRAPYDRLVRSGSSRRRADTLIVCYHAISARWPAALAITVEQLHDQLEWLLAQGYRGATFTDAVTQRRSHPTVAVTFDDAFASVREQAAPVMATLGLPGTVFAVTDFADSGRRLAWDGIDHWIGGEHDAELRGMSWPELRRLEHTGWEIASHTVTHPRLTTLDDERLARELRDSRAACEQGLGHPVASIAYPYGDVDARVVRATAAAGYAAGASLPAFMGPHAALDWPRVGIYRADSLARVKLKVSPTVRRLRTTLSVAERAARDRVKAVRRPAR